MEPEESASGPRITLGQEWAVIAGTLAILWALMTLEFFLDPEGFYAEGHTPFGVLMMIVAILGQAIWISMDRTRRGLEVGWWRFTTVLAGVIVIPVYLVTQYNLKGLGLTLIYFGLLCTVGVWGMVLDGVLGDWMGSRFEGGP